MLNEPLRLKACPSRKRRLDEFAKANMGPGRAVINWIRRQGFRVLTAVGLLPIIGIRRVGALEGIGPGGRAEAEVR